MEGNKITIEGRPTQEGMLREQQSLQPLLPSGMAAKHKHNLPGVKCTSDAMPFLVSKPGDVPCSKDRKQACSEVGIAGGQESGNISEQSVLGAKHMILVIWGENAQSSYPIKVFFSW